MLDYLRRRLYNWLQEENHRQNSVELKPLQIENLGPDRLLTSRPLNFSLYRASGGWIVETRNQQDFDQRQGIRVSADEARPKLHIVHEDQDLGESLGKIVFMENLQK